MGPDGQQAGEITGQLEVGSSDSPGADSQHQLIFGLPNISFQGAGRYAFHVLVGGDDKARVPLEVVPFAHGEEETNGH